MRATLLLTTFLLMLPFASAGAQGGEIIVAGDPALFECYVSDDFAVITTVYVIHTNAAWANGARFSVTGLDSYSGGGMTMTIVSESAGSNLAIGNVETGVEVVYVGCKPLPWVIYQIDYLGLGTSAACSKIVPAPHHEDSMIEAIDCNGNTLAANCAGVYVNGDYNSCYCHNGAGCVPTTVPAEQTTWGEIKALYRISAE